MNEVNKAEGKPQIDMLSKILTFVFFPAIMTNVFGMFIEKTILGDVLSTFGSYFTTENIINLSVLLDVVIVVRVGVTLTHKKMKNREGYLFEYGSILGWLGDPLMTSIALYCVIGAMLNQNMVKLVQVAYQKNLFALLGITILWMYSLLISFITLYRLMSKK